MLILLVLFAVGTMVIGWLFASKMDGINVGKMVGGAITELLTGFFMLEITSEVIISLNYDWAKTLKEEFIVDGFLYLLFRFIGWTSIVLGAAHFLHALIKSLSAVAPKNNAQWPVITQMPEQQPAPAPVEPETIFCAKCGRKQRKSNTTCWACGANLHE